MISKIKKKLNPKQSDESDEKKKLKEIRHDKDSKDKWGKIVKVKKKKKKAEGNYIFSKTNPFSNTNQLLIIGNIFSSLAFYKIISF